MKRNTELTDCMLLDIIKKKVKRKVSFLELERDQQRSVLDYIVNNHLNIRVLGYKWYDVLSKNFFAVEYKPREESMFGIEETELSFDSFEDFYNCVGEDIYQNSCFYGYCFSKEEISNFNIDTSSINFDSFVKETIDEYTFESLNALKKEDENVNLSRASSMVKWFQNHEAPTSLKELEKIYKQFTKRFSFWESKNIFFSVILRMHKESIKDSAIQFACKYDAFDGLPFDKILLVYGREAALYVIEHFDGMCSYATKKRRIRDFKDKLAGYDSGTFQLHRRLGFDSSLQLYFVRDRYYNNKNYPVDNQEYFESFDEFVKYVDGNLSGADLSKAPIERKEVLKYKTDSKTKLPLSKKYETYEMKKKYTDDGFVVRQRWLDCDGLEILRKEHTFKKFFDYVHFLKGDISESDLLLCDGIENINTLSGLNLNGIKVRSEIAEKLGLPLRLIPEDKFKTKDFEETDKYELETVENLLTEHPDDDDYSGRVSYITDIHLLHRFDAYKCKTLEDVNYVIKTIAKTIGEQATGINLIGGDTSSDFEVFKVFISNLSSFRKAGDFFFTLGNHELWGMNGESLYSIVEKYKEVLEQIGHGRMHLIQNNLFYFSEYDWKELSENELFSLSSDEIRAKTRDAKVIIFGGIGFAGMSEEFNANNGIYEDVLDRENEKIESAKFLTLYEKITKALQNRNLIVFTHMPMKDWGGVDMHAKEGVVYVNGHSHRNYFYDDGKKRIYADNQVGYRGRRLSLKQVAINFDFDWFGDYKDGIYEITKEDYENFYRGVGEGLTFNRQYEKLFMIKREGAYMFLMQTPKGSMLILNGGSIKRAGNHTLEYFYDNLVKYSKSVSLFLSKFDAYQKQVSSELKRIGADGTIHGSIVDIDFYNHLYLNPLDGSVTPYFAYSMVDKYFYDNLPSLLKYQCPKIYQNYQRLIEQKDAIDNALVVRDSNLPVSKHKTYVGSTEMYKVSRVLKGLQFTTKYNIVRLWNDAIVADASEENGRLIVSGIIDPDSMPKPVVEIKPKVKIVREPKPKVIKVVLSEEEKIKIRDDKYKEKIMSETNGKVSCTAYRGSTEKADYHCNVCNHEWSTRPDHFKDRQLYRCPACSGTRIKVTFPVNARQENDDEERTKEKEVHIVSKHENSGIKTIRKNERGKVIDSLVLSFTKDNNGSFSKQDLFKKLVDNKGMEVTITKNSVINSVSRLEEKNYVVVSSGKIFITDEGIKSVSKQ